MKNLSEVFSFSLADKDIITFRRNKDAKRHVQIDQKEASFTSVVSYKKIFKHISEYTEADHKKHSQRTFQKGLIQKRIAQRC